MAWPLAPAQADVIDDFEQGQKFMLWGEVAEPDCQFVDHQLKLRFPRSGAWASLIYKRIYPLAEGEPIEFRLDAVSANAGDVWVCLAVGFAGPIFPKAADRGYFLYVLHNRVVLQKLWDDYSGAFFDSGLATDTRPKTLSLTFTREGGNLRVAAKVVLRDNPQKVLFSGTAIDRPGSDTTVSGVDPGPPPPGPAISVFVNTRSTSGLAPEVVVDSLVCSKDQATSLLGIQRKGATEATLAWPGWNIALESDSVEGPWRPCPEPVAMGAGEYTSAVALGGSARYFRLAQGHHVFDHFSSADSPWPWRIVSVVPGSAARPAWILTPSQSRAQILGQTTRNEDFMLRWGAAGIWYRDCAASVDIIDWGEAMEDGTFGIILRAKPDGNASMWFNTAPGLPNERYAGLLTFKKADNAAESALAITGPGGEMLKEVRFPAVNPEKQYRLRFWAVGDQLTLELFDRDNLDAPIQTVTVTDGRIPEGIDGLYGTKSAGGTYDVTIDQSMLSGATVY